MDSQEEEGCLSQPVRNAAMKELAHGRDSVAKLASLLQLGSSENHWPETATAALVIEEIRGAIDKAMVALESAKMMDANRVDSPSCITSSKQGTEGKRKIQNTRKSGYRRRGSPYSWTRIASTTIDDAYTWRKYGQKDIFSAKYPRSYFRCTHKFDRGCKASKQVQRSEDDPSLFVITYFGEHTCGDATKATPPCRDPSIISFESSNGSDMKQESLSSLPPLKQESGEEALSNLSSVDSPSDFFVSTEVDFRKFTEVRITADLGPEHNGLTSDLHSSFINYGMELLDFDDLLNFDHTELFQY